MLIILYYLNHFSIFEITITQATNPSLRNTPHYPSGISHNNSKPINLTLFQIPLETTNPQISHISHPLNLVNTTLPNPPPQPPLSKICPQTPLKSHTHQKKDPSKSGAETSTCNKPANISQQVWKRKPSCVTAGCFSQTILSPRLFILILPARLISVQGEMCYRRGNWVVSSTKLFRSLFGPVEFFGWIWAMCNKSLIGFDSISNYSCDVGMLSLGENSVP